MEKRFVLFIVLSMVTLFGYQYLMRALGVFPPPPQAVAPDDPARQEKPDKEDPAKEPADQDDADKNKAEPDNAQPQDAAAAPGDDEATKPAEPRWVTRGSVDAGSPYRMLVTWTSAGAAVERIELSSNRFHELIEEPTDPKGYLGHLAETPAPDGVVANVVGDGTPAAKAGLRPGDVITALDGDPIADPAAPDEALKGTEPRQVVTVSIRRDQQPLELEVTLEREPLQVIRPEFKQQGLRTSQPGPHDPLSFQMTLSQRGDAKLAGDQKELPGLDLLTGHWELLDEPAEGNDGLPQVAFRRRLQGGLEIIKRYRLAKVGGEVGPEPAYHLLLKIEIANRGQADEQVAYRLLGPTGLLIEGWWYASKLTPGLRDIVAQFGATYADPLSTQEILEDKGTPRDIPAPLMFMGVDAQYFAAVLIPQQKDGESWFASWLPVVASNPPPDDDHAKIGNVTFQLNSTLTTIPPGGPPLEHEFIVFTGPKDPDILAAYGSGPSTLEPLVDYGWFDWVATAMLWILHFFYGIVRNYGIAIILLTVLVRGCMFPLSKKQALSAQKMQELQPEMKRINEKYKGNNEARAKATQELFRKHNYNPLGGCLLKFLQLPIFIGLYRSLMVDVELRQAPLLSETIRWCSNLGAPDMLFYWGNWPLPDFLIGKNGFLGPYFNILPIITVGLFIWQQKMFMPPPTDEQAALQQKIMRYMMVVIGFMFFKVASGLCIYFIASSLWGIAERKLLPKAVASTSTPSSEVATTKDPVAVSASSNGAGSGSGGSKKKKQRGKR